MSAALREPGGAWGPVRDITDDDDLAGDRVLAVGVSEHADALLAIARHRAGDRVEIEAFRRAAGGGFGGRELLFSAARSRSGTTTVQAGHERRRARRSSRGPSSRARGRRASCGRRSPRPAPRSTPRCGSASFAADRPSRSRSAPAATPLLAFAAGAELQVADRLPGADFGVAAPVGVADDLYAVPARGRGARGRWGGGRAGSTRSTVPCGPSPRDRAGAFGPAVSVAPPVPLGFPRGVLRGAAVGRSSPATSTSRGTDPASGLPNAAMGPAGRW